MNFASSESKISKKSENNNIADDTGNHKKGENPLTRHQYIPKTCTMKTSENAKINIVQKSCESVKKPKSTIDGGRLFQTEATRCTEKF